MALVYLVKFLNATVCNGKKKILKNFKHSVVNKSVYIYYKVYCFSFNYYLLKYPRIIATHQRAEFAVKENMNLFSFLVALGDQGEFFSGKHCMPKWALGSAGKPAGFCALSTWPPPKK